MNYKLTDPPKKKTVDFSRAQLRPIGTIRHISETIRQTRLEKKWIIVAVADRVWLLYSNSLNDNAKSNPLIQLF